MALESYQRSVELDPQSWEAWSQITILLEPRGDHAGATATAQKAIDIGTSRHDQEALAAGYNGLGIIEANLGRVDAARVWLTKARGNFLATGANVKYAERPTISHVSPLAKEITKRRSVTTKNR